jgi:hypothetical protein
VAPEVDEKDRLAGKESGGGMLRDSDDAWMTRAEDGKSLPKGVVPLLFLVLSLACCWPLLKDPYLSCRGDWDYFSFLQEAASISIFEYHQFPLWNPYNGGGISFIGSPQVAFPSPIFLTTSLFGVFAGLKIAVWLHTFIGLWGMWLLSGHQGVRGPARFIPSFIFMFSTAWALHLAEGHMVWLPAAFLPLLLLAFLKGMENSRWLVAAAIVESMMFYEGGALVLSFSLVFMLVYAAVDSLVKRTAQPLSAFLIVNLASAALSAPRLLPALELLGKDPRPIDAGTAVPWDEYLGFLLDRYGFLASGGWESGSYVGLTVVVLYLFSLSLCRKQLPLVVASIFMLLLSLGNFAPWSPWKILHALPLFSSYKIPGRSFIVFCFSVALLVGLFVGRPQGVPDRRVMFIVTLLMLFIGGDLLLASNRIFAEAPKPVKVSVMRADFTIAEVKPQQYRLSRAESTGLGHTVDAIHRPFSQVRVPDLERYAHGAWSDQYLPLLRNTGVVDSYEAIPFRQLALAVTDPGYRGEFYLNGKGKVALTGWSPNRLVFHAVLRERDRLVINQNFRSGWHSSCGAVTESGGLLAVDLPVGDYDLSMWYRPRSFVIGVGFFLAAAAWMAATLLRKAPAEEESIQASG